MLAVKAAALAALCLGFADGANSPTLAEFNALFEDDLSDTVATIAKAPWAATAYTGSDWTCATDAPAGTCSTRLKPATFETFAGVNTAIGAVATQKAAVQAASPAHTNIYTKEIGVAASTAAASTVTDVLPAAWEEVFSSLVAVDTWTVSAAPIAAADVKVTFTIVGDDTLVKTVAQVTAEVTAANIGTIGAVTASAVSAPVHDDGKISVDITFPGAASSAASTTLAATLAKVALVSGVSQNRVFGTLGGTTTTTISATIIANGGYSKTAADVNAAVTVAAMGSLSNKVRGVAGTSPCTAVNSAVKTNGVITQTLTFTNSVAQTYNNQLIYRALDKVSQLVGVHRTRVEGTATESGSTSVIVVRILAHDFRAVTTSDVTAAITAASMTPLGTSFSNKFGIVGADTVVATGTTAKTTAGVPVVSGSNIAVTFQYVFANALDATAGTLVATNGAATVHVNNVATPVFAMNRMASLLGVARSRLSVTTGVLPATSTGTNDATTESTFTITLIATPTTTTSTTTTTTTTSSTVATQRTVTTTDIAAKVTTASVGVVGGLQCSAVSVPTVSGTTITQTATFPGTVASAPNGFLVAACAKISTAAEVDPLRVSCTMADGSIVVTALISTVGVTSTTTTVSPGSAATRTVSTVHVAAAVTVTSVGTVGGYLCFAVGTPTAVGLYIVQTISFPNSVAVAPVGFLNMVLDKVATLVFVTRARVTGTMANGSIIVTSSICSVSSCVSNGNNGLSGGEIAGVVVGSIAGAALIAGAIWFFACRK